MVELVNWPTAITSISGAVISLLTYLNTRKINKRSASNSLKLDKNIRTTEETSCQVKDVANSVNGRIDLLLKTHADLALAKVQLTNEYSNEVNQIHQAEMIILNAQQKELNVTRLGECLSGPTHFNQVLVVEDDEFDARLFSITLSQLNLVGTIAKNSVDVVTLMAQKRFDAAFIDLNLPGSLNGYDILKIMTIVNSDMPLFVVTGYCDERITKAIKLLGAIAILKKPVSVEDLRKLFTSLLVK